MAGCGRAGCKSACSIGDICINTEQVIRFFKNAEFLDEKFVEEGHKPVALKLAKKEINFLSCRRLQAQKARELNEGLKLLLKPGALDSASRKTFKKLGGK